MPPALISRHPQLGPWRSFASSCLTSFQHSQTFERVVFSTPHPSCVESHNFLYRRHQQTQPPPSPCLPLKTPYIMELTPRSPFPLKTSASPYQTWNSLKIITTTITTTTTPGRYDCGIEVQREQQARIHWRWQK